MGEWWYVCKCCMCCCINLSRTFSSYRLSLSLLKNSQAHNEFGEADRAGNYLKMKVINLKITDNTMIHLWSNTLFITRSTSKTFFKFIGHLFAFLLQVLVFSKIQNFRPVWTFFAHIINKGKLLLLANISVAFPLLNLQVITCSD